MIDDKQPTPQEQRTLSMLTDVHYALRQLRTARNMYQSPEAVADCVGRAIEAMERVADVLGEPAGGPPETLGDMVERAGEMDNIKEYFLGKG